MPYSPYTDDAELTPPTFPPRRPRRQMDENNTPPDNYTTHATGYGTGTGYQQPQGGGGYYPNGVERRPWDERTPSGRTVNEEIVAQGGGGFNGKLERAFPSGHPPLGPQPERPAGIPTNSHWDATGANPSGGEWISGGSFGNSGGGTGFDGTNRHPRTKRPIAAPPAPNAPAIHMPDTPTTADPGGYIPSEGQAQPSATMQRAPQPGDAGVLSGDDPRAQQRRGWMVSPSQPDANGQPARRGSFSDRQSQIDIMRRAPATSEVGIREGGGYQAAPPTKPSRKKQALMGLLQGALAGASKTGTLGGAIGGAGVGAAAGGINPRLMKALERDQDIRRLQGQQADDLSLQTENAKLEGTQAQTEYTRKRTRTGDKHYVERLDGVYEISDEYPQGRRVGNIAPEGGRSGTRHYFEREDGVYYTDDAHPEGTKLSGVPGKPPSGASTDIAEEGAEAEAQAGRAESDIQAEIETLKKGTEGNKYTDATESGRKWVSERDARWAKRASDIVNKWVPSAGSLEKPTMSEALAQAKSEDNDYSSGTYDTTVKNTEAKEKRLGELEKELSDVRKERRGGAAKSARGSARSKVGSDGKHHYKLADIKSAAGANYEAVLKRLRADKRVVIDDDK